MRTLIFYTYLHKLKTNSNKTSTNIYNIMNGRSKTMTLEIERAGADSNHHHHQSQDSSCETTESLLFQPQQRKKQQLWKQQQQQQQLPEAIQLLIGAGGIYAAFLYYGSLQEDVFRYTAQDGSSFKQAWFLQVLESLANVIVGFVGMQIAGPTPGIPKRMFGLSGFAQVSAKACTSLALANGLSFPVATLAKSGKMAPVMMGSLFLGGASYTIREYLQVLAIIGGTAIVSMGKKKSGNNSSTDSSFLGVFYIIMALVFDGVTAGYQKRLQRDMASVGVKPKPYDYMFWTNLFMCLTAFMIAVALGEVTAGLAFCFGNPEIFSKIIQFSVCSAVGQSFIFYTLAHFDPLVLSTVTTTRKIFSVLLSIFFKGHSLSLMGWGGVNLASLGIVSELQAKMVKSRARVVSKESG